MTQSITLRKSVEILQVIRRIAVESVMYVNSPMRSDLVSLQYVRSRSVTPVSNWSTTFVFPWVRPFLSPSPLSTETYASAATIDITSDVNNCGAVGKICSFPNGVGKCSSSVCTFTSCATGYLLASNTCSKVDTTSDVR
jgi:hypothetical protein